MTARSSTPEAFSALLQEKLDELDQAAQHELLLEHDEVERLRLQAAYLVSGTHGKPWLTGAVKHFQGDLVSMDVPPPTLDISYPAPPGRQGRRIPGHGHFPEL